MAKRTVSVPSISLPSKPPPPNWMPLPFHCVGRFTANRIDGAAFAAQFTSDADVINIFGEHFRGGPDLVRRMQFIFDGIFKGSKHVERKLEIARYLDEGTILVVTSSVIAVPQGPLAPETRNRQTFILVLDGADWRIRHWQNTTIRPGN